MLSDAEERAVFGHDDDEDEVYEYSEEDRADDTLAYLKDEGKAPWQTAHIPIKGITPLIVHPFPRRNRT